MCKRFKVLSNLPCNACDAELLFDEKKNGNKKQEDKHFDFECNGYNGYKDLGPPLKPMRI